jgi:hypothetical protein
MNSIARVASLVVLCSVVAIADASVDGHWTGDVANDGSTQSIEMYLRTDDTRLSGSIIGGGGFETSIEDGKFTGNTLEFKTVQRDGENKLTVNCIGSLVADAISFSCTAEGTADAREFTVRRQANP